MFYPMFIMILLTFAVSFYLLGLRISAVKRQQISVGYFRTNSGASEPPVRVQQAANHFGNLFEVPLLFYVTCLMVMTLNYQNSLLEICAWVFVITRVIHGYIHLTYNNVLHRMLAFFAGVICILIMWVVLAAHMAARQSMMQ